MKSVVHDNLLAFVGACVDPPDNFLIWIYCPKGSLAVCILAIIVEEEEETLFVNGIVTVGAV